MKRMRRKALLPPKCDAAAGTSEMFGHLALTVLQQSHLCPLPLVLQPVYWQYDHALHLYPLPSVVVIADSLRQAEHSHRGCRVLNPVSAGSASVNKCFC